MFTILDLNNVDTDDDVNSYVSQHITSKDDYYVIDGNTNKYKWVKVGNDFYWLIMEIKDDCTSHTIINWKCKLATDHRLNLRWFDSDGSCPNLTTIATFSTELNAFFEHVGCICHRTFNQRNNPPLIAYYYLGWTCNDGDGFDWKECEIPYLFNKDLNDPIVDLASSIFYGVSLYDRAYSVSEPIENNIFKLA